MFIVLTHHKLYNKDVAKKYIASFDPILDDMDSSLYPEHIKLITMDELISFFSISSIPLENLQSLRNIKDQALSHNPDISNQAFDTLYQLYMKAKLTLKLIKSDPANAVQILKTRQLDMTKFIGDPNKKIGDLV